jgi:hypothetical protein
MGRDLLQTIITPIYIKTIQIIVQNVEYYTYVDRFTGKTPTVGDHLQGKKTAPGG